MKRTLKRWLTYALVVVTVLRGLIFLARLGGVIGVVEAVAIAFGYNDAVTHFEDSIDSVVMIVMNMITQLWSRVSD